MTIKNTPLFFCEFCQNEFKSLPIHVFCHSDKCKEQYLTKYGSLDNLPWKKTSDSNPNLFFCEICDKRCIGRGLINHVLQYSTNCYEGYRNKYGIDRSNWPGRLKENKYFCEECRIQLRPDSKTNGIPSKYCAECRRKKYNVMKIEENKKKVSEKIKEIWKNEKFRKKMKKSFKTRNTPERSKKQSLYMLSGGSSRARAGIKSPSKPQVELYHLIKSIDDSAIMEYPIIENNIQYIIDIALPSKKIAIEYDGSYWHKDKEKDRIRQKFIENLGWKVIRYRDIVPSIEQINIDLQ